MLKWLQVWSVLEALDRDYKRDEDWCSSDKSANQNRAAFLVQLINKHNEQKEAFLRVNFHFTYMHLSTSLNIALLAAVLH
jgi:hypothetical protein